MKSTYFLWKKLLFKCSFLFSLCINVILLQVIRSLTFQYCAVIRHSSPSWIQYWSNLVRFPSPALAADRLAWCQTEWVIEELEPNMHNLNMNTAWLESRQKQKLNGIQRRVVLIESDYRFGLEVDYQFGCLICWVSLFVINVSAAEAGMWSNVQLRHRELMHGSKGDVSETGNKI